MFKNKMKSLALVLLLSFSLKGVPVIGRSSLADIDRLELFSYHNHIGAYRELHKMGAGLLEKPKFDPDKITDPVKLGGLMEEAIASGSAMLSFATYSPALDIYKSDCISLSKALTEVSGLDQYLKDSIGFEFEENQHLWFGAFLKTIQKGIVWKDVLMSTPTSR